MQTHPEDQELFLYTRRSMSWGDISAKRRLALATVPLIFVLLSCMKSPEWIKINDPESYVQFVIRSTLNGTIDQNLQTLLNVPDGKITEFFENESYVTYRIDREDKALHVLIDGRKELNNFLHQPNIKITDITIVVNFTLGLLRQSIPSLEHLPKLRAVFSSQHGVSDSRWIIRRYDGYEVEQRFLGLQSNSDGVLIGVRSVALRPPKTNH